MGYPFGFRKRENGNSSALLGTRLACVLAAIVAKKIFAAAVWNVTVLLSSPFLSVGRPLIRSSVRSLAFCIICDLPFCPRGKWRRYVRVRRRSENDEREREERKKWMKMGRPRTHGAGPGRTTWDHPAAATCSNLEGQREHDVAFMSGRDRPPSTTTTTTATAASLSRSVLSSRERVKGRKGGHIFAKISL